MHSFLHSLGEWAMPVLKSSKFKETGVLTPEEFVIAGDFLVYKCPTWAWESGEESKRRPYLPADKQFLITRNVPCRRRCKEMMGVAMDADERHIDGGDDDDVDGWVETHITTCKEHETVEDMGSCSRDSIGESSEPLLLVDAAVVASGNGSIGLDVVEDSDSDIPDMDDFDDDQNVLEEEDPSALTSNLYDNILRVRSYDMSVSYDKYYQTPRTWLFGYDESRKPLSVDKMFEDMSAEHANKTVTMEMHPHLSFTQASIHPCKHANVMKKIIAMRSDSGRELGVHMYVMIFLKFVQSVIPTIEYDFTHGI